MLSSLRIFLKVVESGSFSKAAKILNIAPSTVTRAIDTLEQEFGTAFFERSTRTLHMTDKGLQFLDGAQKLLQDADNLKASMAPNKVEAKGLLRLSVFESFGRLHLCPLLPEFLARYPNIDIQIELENNMVDLSGENIDIAIRVGIPQDSQLKARVLLPNHTVVCAAPDYLQRHGEPAEPADLQSHNCLLLNRSRQRVYWHFSKNKQQQKILVKGNLSSKGGTPILSAGLLGLGIMQLSNWIVADYVKRGELKLLLNDWQASLGSGDSGNVYAVYKTTSYPNPLIRLFLDFLLEKIQGKTLQRLTS